MQRMRQFLISALGVALSLFTISEVNYGLLPPLSQLAVFAAFGLVLCFLIFPVHRALSGKPVFRVVDLLLCVATVICCGYLVWEGTALQDRVGQFTQLDYVIAVAGTLLVLEATRRSIGWALPILAGAFLLYAYYGASLPEWMFFHRGYGVDRIAAKCFLGSEGIFGIAMRVMFTYVFLFVIFGGFLEVSGATGFIIDFAKAVFGRSPGGPAKVSVLASGLMGSLSGSAVANAVTTGAFTIPMMRSAGFRPHVAGGITAAAASGGALVPPVMGAGAYMMLEIIKPPVTFMEIMKAALIPAVLYYLSILLIVHFYSRRVGAETLADASPHTPLPGGEGREGRGRSLLQFEGVIFFGALGALIGFLIAGYTPFRAVTYSVVVILLLTIVRPGMAVGWQNRMAALAGFIGVTVLIALFRVDADHILLALEGTIWHGVVSVLATVFASSPDLKLTDWATWADSTIPTTVVVLLLGLLHRVWRPLIHDALVKSARNGISLVAAAGCVGIILSVVTLTGVGTAFPNTVVPLAEQNLFLALVAIMVCSIVLGMGLPSAVCYLLIAVLIGPVLSKLGVIPLAAHLFIFYFGMMSMVTPPVALAAYASASIAGSDIMRTAFSSFVFALVGFTLPYMFVYRPELLLLSNQPEVVVLRSEGVASAKASAGRTRIVGRLDRFENPVPDVQLVFSAADGSTPDQTIKTDAQGRFEIDLERKAWSVGMTAESGERRHLGRLIVGSPRPGNGAPESEGTIEFHDERLSVLQVFAGTATAALGILALAAGIAGYMRAPLNLVLRLLAFGTAALLLFPGRGVLLGTVYIAVSDLAGLVLFGVVLVLNGRAAKQALRLNDPPEPRPGR